MLGRRYLDSFPEAYKEDFSARTAAVDLGRLEGISGEEGLDHSLYEDVDAGRGEARLKVYRIGPPLSLSQILPMPQLDGRRGRRRAALRARRAGARPPHLRVRPALPGRCPSDARELFQDAVRAVWDGYTEIDGFNALVLGAGLTWRQATVLRAYAKYMRQGGSPVRAGLHRGGAARQRRHHPDAGQLFEARFDPAATAAQRQEDAARERASCARSTTSSSLDHDRILRSYLTHIRATLRTNYFQHADADGGGPSPTSRFKLEPVGDPGPARAAAQLRDLRLLPAGRGRAPALRRGGARRPALVGPPRRLPHRGAGPGQGADGQEHRDRAGRREGRLLRQAAARPELDRDAWLAEGIACYTTFICGLLDITDNLVDGETVPPAARACATTATTPTSWSPPTRAPRPSPTSPTGSRRTTASGSATPSPAAARSATTTRRWASPPAAPGSRCSGTSASAASTARREDFTCVGIGDMSGDVFGNGMLCSEHTRLVAAFDHRDIFLDPDPDAATSYAERQRLFDLPRSSWQDYDASLISAGGGVYSRSRSRSRSTPEMREALGIAGDVEAMTPAELMRAILHRAGRPAVERRHRHLRQGRERDPRRRRRQGQRRDPRRRPRAARAVRRRGRQPGPHPARPHRVRLRTRRAGSTPTSSTTPPASTPPTTR